VIALLIVGSFLVAAALIFGCLIARTRPTKGNKIANYPDPQMAAVIIDLQEDYTGTGARPPFPYKDSARVIQTLNALANDARLRRILVIYVRQEFGGLMGRVFSKTFSHGTALPDTPSAALDRRLAVGSHPVFTKSTADAFSSSAFEMFLIEHRVNELFLAGLDAEYCVRSTAKAGLARGYKGNIISDGILLLAEKHRDALWRQFQRDGTRLVSSTSCFA
jgi:nicotinamidase-related amidase